MAEHDNEEEFLGLSYDVFLSFRGEDTRQGFIGHMRHALCRKGVIPFIDDEDLEMGKSISPALTKAIEESRVFMVVFSENYASSTWCLDELVEILKRSKNRDKKPRVLPIFYHVDPSDIRHQRNRYGKHMIVHENNFGKDSQRVKDWRSALTEASNFPGEHFTTRSHKYEINLIDEIVEKVYKNIAPKPLLTGQNPVGLEPRIEKVKSLLGMKPGDETVCMLGIYGLGGIGKTELAKALYDKIVRDFDAASFLADVREKSNKINGLEDLQKTLLSEMLEDLQNELGSPSKGMYEIKCKLHRKKVLLVLDDVDDKEKLEKLAGRCDWFGPGSRIIITTRDKDVLIAHKVEKIYEMKELDEKHSLDLFCWNAFKQSHPKTGFGDLSLRAVDFAKRLPLALIVIGSDLATLHEESLDAWECALEEYVRTPPNKRIIDVLKISYDRLSDNARQVFLDIACFFKGEKIEYVKNILHEFGASNINVLVNKSLLTIEYGCLKMHDLIQDMGREVVRLEAPNKLGERSRLWYYEDVIEMLTENYGSDNIQGILLDPPQREEVSWSGTAFEKMKWLRILIVRNTVFSSEPEHLPNHLRVLDWEEYPSKSLPSKFYPKKIVVFNLLKSHITLEEPFKKFSCLTNMDFSYNESITKMPDVSEVQNLRELRLDHCRNLIAIHDSVGFLQRLSHLSASECTKLRNLMQKMFLPSLEVLDLNLCGRLEHFPEITKEMNKPLKIYMRNTAIKMMPESIDKLIGLISLETSSSKKLQYLPIKIFMLPNASAFKIGGCSQLLESFRNSIHSLSAASVSPTLKTLHLENATLSDEDLPAILNCFPKLEELIASKNNFIFTACIKEHVHLTSVDLSHCMMLQKIPECPNLRILKVNHCVNLKKISEVPFIHKLDARHTSLTRETSDILWFQAAKGMRELEVVMPQTEIPEWFDFIDNAENPQFWARGKLPIFALALVFQDVTGWGRQGPHHIIQLQLVINSSRCVSCKDYQFRIATNHVLICDLRLLFSEEEWLGLNAFLEHDDWNVVQVSYQAPPPLILSQWGVYVYEEGANMEDVKFVCPEPKYLEMSPPIVVSTKKDPKQERRKLIENLCTDELLEDSMFEYMDYCVNRKDLTGEDMEKVYSVIAYFKEVNRQAKDELASSEGSDLEEKHSLLTQFLKTYYGLVPSIQEEKNDLQQKKEKMRKIFTDGIRDGLLKAQKKFPSLNIIKTRSVASIKGIRVQWMFEEVPEFTQLYIGGIISGLLEAKLSFPYLDLSAILNPVFHAIGMNKGLHDMFGRPLIRVLNEVNVDIEQQELIRYIYYDGITDGLYEARKNFPSLDIIETRSVALNKIASWSKLLLREDLVQALPTVVEKTYTDGILGGLVEAKLSFPDLNIMAIVVSVLCRMEIAELVIVDNEPEEFHRKNLALMRENDKGKRPMNVGEASASNHHGSEEEQRNDPQWGELMKEIFYEGLTDGLVQAKNSLPSLDIDKTRSAALNKKIYGDRAAWSLEEPKDEGHPQDPLGRKIYIEGIMNGLLEAKLSFPNLDIWATLNTLQSRRLKGTFLTLSSDLKLDKTEVIPPPCSHDPLLQTSIMMKQQSSKSDEAAEREFPLKLMEEHGALRNKFVQLESENVAPNKDSDAARSWKTQSQSDVSNKLDFNSGTKSLM